MIVQAVNAEALNVQAALSSRNVPGSKQRRVSDQARAIHDARCHRAGVRGTGLQLHPVRDPVVAAGRHRGQPQGHLHQFRHDSGALTRVIDQLADRGLLERVRRDRDRRKVELQLTEAGRKTVEGLVPLVVDKLNLALFDFSSEEFQEFLRLLLKLNTRLQSTLDAGTAVGSES